MEITQHVVELWFVTLRAFFGFELIIEVQTEIQSHLSGSGRDVTGMFLASSSFIGPKD